MNNIALVLFSFDRYDYLQKTINSLENAEGIEDIDCYFFQDNVHNSISGNTYGDEKDVEKCMQVMEDSSIEFVEVFKNKENKGIARQKHKANQLFNNYSRIMFFEDDMIVGKNYLKLLNKASKQYPHYTITMYNNQSSGSLNKLSEFHGARSWGYIMTSSLYARIENDWNFYMDKMKDVDYQQRTAMPGSFRNKLKDRISVGNVCHDVVLSNCIYTHGKGKLKPYATRGKYIGKHGAYAYSPHFWEKKGMNDQADKLTYENELEINSFQIV